MKNSGINRQCAIALLLGACMLAGCGGTKVLKDPVAMQVSQPLASVADQRVAATLNWVIVRGGPGTWAKNADWDEYLVTIENRSGETAQVTQLVVVDSLGTRIEPQFDRKQLVSNSKANARRYKESGIKVKAGFGSKTMLITGAAVTAVGVSAATAVAATSGLGAGAAAAGTAGAAAGGLLLLGPALAVGGIVRGVNNSKVNSQIETRQTLLPHDVAAGEELELDVFFPLAPSPGLLEITYSDASGEHVLAIDTSAALDGLHIEAGKDQADE